MSLKPLRTRDAVMWAGGAVSALLGIVLAVGGV